MRKKPARPAVVPVLVPCPSCKLPVQPGKNPDGLAWHDCQFVVDGNGHQEVTVEGIRALVLRRLRDQAATANPKECIAVLAALERMAPKPEPEVAETAVEGDEDLVAWMAASTPRPRARG